ncbi:MAG: DoxX family protein [Planctomycetaceae bacterium]|nr:DoxX family protein [Planctomycetaceae bacterium]
MKIAYWITTALLALAYLAGGYFDIAQPGDMGKDLARLGYPSYFFVILGVWKLGASVALLLPGTPRLKEWAYAGILFNLTGASATHLFVKDPIGEAITPMIILAIAIASWATRPASRKLAGPWL